MTTSTSGCNDLGVPACWTWIPLQKRETILMIHKITVCAVEVAMPSRFGQSESYHGQYDRPRIREWTTTSSVDLHQWQSGFPQGR